MNKFTEMDYIRALKEAHENQESFQMIESIIYKYFTMMEHMKETSLYDVYTYEEKITKLVTEELDILYHENKKLKKEVNELRKELGLIEKYKIKT